MPRRDISSYTVFKTVRCEVTDSYGILYRESKSDEREQAFDLQEKTRDRHLFPTSTGIKEWGRRQHTAMETK